MANFHSHFILFSLLLPFISCDYTLPSLYFINCGSSSTVTAAANFLGDVSFSISSHNTFAVTNTSASPLPLYQTARIFNSSSSYDLRILQNGTYVLRFHFFPFGDLSESRFSVDVSRFRVLQNFSLQNDSVLVVKEFFLTLSPGNLGIKFVPHGHNGFAFINAIEIFLAPPHLNPISENPGNVVLSLVHRINVGGSNITPSVDSLLRNWIPDDDYFLENYISNKTGPYPGKINYPTPEEKYVAPPSVYNTARQTKISGFNVNISWSFPVKRSANHTIRLHFCDIINVDSKDDLAFDLFICSKYIGTIKSHKGSPFFKDYVVESDDSGYINISVGPGNESGPVIAFLNGVEIMEMVTAVETSCSWRGKYLAIGLCSIGTLGCLVLVVVLFFVCRRRKWTSKRISDLPLDGGVSEITEKTVSGSHLSDLSHNLKIPFSEILYATKNFDSKLMIGEGGFGKVYRGVLRNGREVVVKRREPGHAHCQLPESLDELSALSRIRNHNLVSFVGYCDDRFEMILVYEYMENGTLRDHLYVSSSSGESWTSRPRLSWEQRLRICIGAAKGLNYLHTSFIHGNVKSSNVFLGEHYVAKVADFGLCRPDLDPESIVSFVGKGNFEYIDPEYFILLQLTQKSDVYSFGVLLLEVLCARPVVNVAEWRMLWQRRGEVEGIVDPFLLGKINPNSLRKFGETIEKCLKEKGDERLNMVDVVWDLEYCLQLHLSSIPKGPYEDSNDISFSLLMNVVHRFPSHSIQDDDEEEEDPSKG